MRNAHSFVGSWRNTSTTGLEPYLKRLGVGWAKRKLALAFRPEPSFAVVDGVLQFLMSSPIGERLERMPIGEEIIDVDPTGKEFIKVSRWEGSKLITVAKDRSGKSSDFVTTRHIRDDGTMTQITTHDDTSFERIFVRK